MQKYFIHDGHKQLGPFSAAQLRDRNVTRCTPVKTGDQNNYVTACEIPELNEMLRKLRQKVANNSIKDKLFINNAFYIKFG